MFLAEIAGKCEAFGFSAAIFALSWEVRESFSVPAVEMMTLGAVR